MLGAIGVATAIVGTVLYANAEQLQSHAHLLIPLPPITVAAYIYALSRFGPIIDGDVTRSTLMATVNDLLAEFVVGGLAFLIISGLMLGIVLVWHSVSR